MYQDQSSQGVLLLHNSPDEAHMAIGVPSFDSVDPQLSQFSQDALPLQRNKTPKECQGKQDAPYCSQDSVPGS